LARKKFFGILGAGTKWTSYSKIQELIVTAEEVDKYKARIDGFASPGHLYFNAENPEIVDHFKKRFDSLGGMTPEISKQLGWDSLSAMMKI
jgi:hypothetical protein